LIWPPLEQSQIDWAAYQPKTPVKLKAKNRGKLIMACGTGKTFTSLKIAEARRQGQARPVPGAQSVAASQTLTEWTQESEIPLHSFAVCSDSDVGKKRKKDDDTVQTFAHELRYPGHHRPKAPGIRP
jgi:predicted helicase